MLMKLAHLDNERISPDIAECCEMNNAHFVPIIKNQFGILTDDFKTTFDVDDSITEPNISLKAFVDVYKCATDTVKKRRFLLWVDHSYSPYNGKILDNLFFKRIINFCNENKIFISYVDIISKYNTPHEIVDTEEITELVAQNGDFIIKKMGIELKNKPIIIDKAGYVDIASNIEFFYDNQEIIRIMLKTGLDE